MATATRKTELSPLEAIVVENTLGEEARRDTREGTLAHIQQLTKERQQLYRFSAAHPFLAARNGQRIREIAAEIEILWETLRRERASRRVAIERALHVSDETDDQPQEPENSHDAA
ncbi:MAG: hypothetical protein ACLQUY_06010 [Ktedonobacterales bacterium]